MGSMSASTSGPLPRLGDVFFDVRGSSRSMRLNWYADTGVAVFSIWQGGTCTGTFRLPADDLARLVDSLRRGVAGGQDGGSAPVPLGGHRPRLALGAAAEPFTGAMAALADERAGYGGSGQYGTGQYDGGRGGAGRYGTDQYNGGYSAGRPDAEQYGASQHSAAPYNGGEHSAAPYNGGEHSAAPYNGGQYSAAQYNGGQHSARQYNGGQYGAQDTRYDASAGYGDAARPYSSGPAYPGTDANGSGPGTGSQPPARSGGSASYDALGRYDRAEAADVPGSYRAEDYTGQGYQQQRADNGYGAQAGYGAHVAYDPSGYDAASGFQERSAYQPQHSYQDLQQGAEPHAAAHAPSAPAAANGPVGGAAAAFAPLSGQAASARPEQPAGAGSSGPAAQPDWYSPSYAQPPASDLAPEYRSAAAQPYPNGGPDYQSAAAQPYPNGAAAYPDSRPAYPDSTPERAAGLPSANGYQQAAPGGPGGYAFDPQGYAHSGSDSGAGLSGTGAPATGYAAGPVPPVAGNGDSPYGTGSYPASGSSTSGYPVRGPGSDRQAPSNGYPRPAAGGYGGPAQPASQPTFTPAGGGNGSAGYSQPSPSPSPSPYPDARPSAQHAQYPGAADSGYPSAGYPGGVNGHAGANGRPVGEADWGGGYQADHYFAGSGPQPDRHQPAAGYGAAGQGEQPERGYWEQEAQQGNWR
jgi:hypothetical protein